MEALSREKVLHVANLGRIMIEEDQIDKFAHGLKQIIDEIDKIVDLDIDEEEILISPSENINVYRADEIKDMLSTQDALFNAPKTKGDYIEVVRVIND